MRPAMHSGGHRQRTAGASAPRPAGDAAAVPRNSLVHPAPFGNGLMHLASRRDGEAGAAGMRWLWGLVAEQR